MSQLRIQGLTKRFSGRPVLEGVDLAVQSGELLVVLGASGCGKTTLLRLVAGFEHADAGLISIGGVVVAAEGLHQPPERRGVGYLAQEGALFPHLTVAGNISFGLERGPGRKRRIGELLEAVGLPQDYAKRFPHQLSGGEQQRVALARALAPAPRLVLLDEPFAALDAALRQEIREMVVGVLRRASATAVLVTHDQSEALSIGDRIAVLRGGRIAQVADPVSLYRGPADAGLAQFVGEAMLVPAVAANGLAHSSLGVFPIASGRRDGPVEVMIRPEQVKLVAFGTPGSIRAQVTDVTFYGHDAMVRLIVSGQPEITLSARLFGQQVPQGADVGVAIEGEIVAYPRPSCRLPSASYP
ncbi:MAG: ABC transporter ATP-binding protein [Stellaceae bacterium]